jgi:hypothetical protein
MNFFEKIFAAINPAYKEKKRKEQEWDKLAGNQKPAQPSHLLPLDPNDPWKT